MRALWLLFFCVSVVFVLLRFTPRPLLDCCASRPRDFKCAFGLCESVPSLDGRTGVFAVRSTERQCSETFELVNAGCVDEWRDLAPRGLIALWLHGFFRARKTALTSRASPRHTRLTPGEARKSKAQRCLGLATRSAKTAYRRRRRAARGERHTEAAPRRASAGRTPHGRRRGHPTTTPLPRAAPPAKWRRPWPPSRTTARRTTPNC